MRPGGGALPLSTRLTISRPTGNLEPRIVVRIDDHATRTTIVEVEVALDEFAMALTGRAEVECSGSVWPVGLARLGMVRENSARTIVVQSSRRSDELRWREAVDAAWREQYPDDAANGWVIFGLDRVPNPHRRGRTEGGEPTYQIAVERYVQPEPVS